MRADRANSGNAVRKFTRPKEGRGRVGAFIQAPELHQHIPAALALAVGLCATARVGEQGIDTGRCFV